VKFFKNNIHMQNVFTLLADDSLKTVTQLINNIYGTGEWSKGYI